MKREEWLDLIGKLSISDDVGQQTDRILNVEVEIKNNLNPALPLPVSKDGEGKKIRGKLLDFDKYMNLGLDKDALARSANNKLWVRGTSVVAIKVVNDFIE